MTAQWVLGCGLSDHECSAVLMRGDEVIVGVAKERVTRRKRHGCGRNDFDDPVVAYCLEAAGIGIDDVDLVVQNSVFPFLCDERYHATLGHYVWGTDARPRMIRINHHPVLSISHHVAHAYSAWWGSGFDEAAVLVVDAMGNEDAALRDFFTGPDRAWASADPTRVRGAWERESCYVARKGRLEPAWKRTERSHPPFHSQVHGLGTLYHDVTEYIFGDGHEAGQTMGLAPYGDPHAFADLRMVELLDRWPYLTFPDRWQRRFAKAWRGTGSDAWPDWGDREAERRNLAARLQLQFEEALFALCRHAHVTTGLRSLCYAGGAALNSVANGKILEHTEFERWFVPPAAGDSGIALGCAFYGHAHLGGRPGSVHYTHDFLGRQYGADQIRQAVEEQGLPWRRVDDPAAWAAQSIAAGRIIGWFQGGSEFGPRALGHRSILCAPRPASKRYELNARVKHRASFRPFAPAVLAERADVYFELDKASPFMLDVARVRRSRMEEIAAVVHVDGTARVQTVHRSTNPRFHALIEYFGELTGTPVVLNTSFNDRGEPIVETPADALTTFRSTGLDALVMGDIVVTTDTRNA